MYYDTHDLLSRNKSRMYDKGEKEQLKVIILYKSMMDSNIFLFYPTELKIGHSKVIQDQVESTYIHLASQ